MAFPPNYMSMALLEPKYLVGIRGAEALFSRQGRGLGGFVAVLISYLVGNGIDTEQSRRDLAVSNSETIGYRNGDSRQLIIEFVACGNASSRSTVVPAPTVPLRFW